MTDASGSMALVAPRLLEELSDRAMPGSDRLQLGPWVLRASRGATSRANTAWAAGRPDLPMMQACDQVERWYRDRDLAPGFQIWNGTDPSLIAELDRRCYRRAEGALVLTRSVAGREASTAMDKSDARLASIAQVVSTALPTAQFFGLFVESDRLQELLDSSLPKCFVTLSDGSGRLLGGGAGVLDGGQLGIFSMTTLVAARRLGVARRVLDEVTEWGITGGATACWLQVMASNMPATRLYTSTGFKRAHQYHYRLAATERR